MTPERREILERVARGELSPEDADEILRGLERPETQAAPAGDQTAGSIRKIKVQVGVGGVDVVGDPGVVGADVDGPHHAEVDGDTLIVRGDLDASRPGAFAIAFGKRGRRIRIGHHHAALDDHHVSRLVIRMNPDLALEAEIDAGPLSISDIRGPIRARLSAGPITIDNFEGPLDVGVDAGAIRALGKLTHGESRIRADAGAVRVELDSSSSVHIVAKAALGKVRVPGGNDDRRGKFGSDRRGETTIGNGDAHLRVETAMGSVHVSVR